MLPILFEWANYHGLWLLPLLRYDSLNNIKPNPICNSVSPSVPFWWALRMNMQPIVQRTSTPLKLLKGNLRRLMGSIPWIGWTLLLLLLLPFFHCDICLLNISDHLSNSIICFYECCQLQIQALFKIIYIEIPDYGFHIKKKFHLCYVPIDEK